MKNIFTFEAKVRKSWEISIKLISASTSQRMRDIIVFLLIFLLAVVPLDYKDMRMRDTEDLLFTTILLSAVMKLGVNFWVLIYEFLLTKYLLLDLIEF